MSSRWPVPDCTSKSGSLAWKERSRVEDVRMAMLLRRIAASASAREPASNTSESSSESLPMFVTNTTEPDSWRRLSGSTTYQSARYCVPAGVGVTIKLGHKNRKGTKNGPVPDQMCAVTHRQERCPRVQRLCRNRCQKCPQTL